MLQTPYFPSNVTPTRRQNRSSVQDRQRQGEKVRLVLHKPRLAPANLQAGRPGVGHLAGFREANTSRRTGKAQNANKSRRPHPGATTGQRESGIKYGRHCLGVTEAARIVQAAGIEVHRSERQPRIK